MDSNWRVSGYRPDEHGWWKSTIDRDDFGYPNGYYFADTVRTVIETFGAFLSNVWVLRFDEEGYPRKSIRVPIKFGPRNKSHDFRREEESNYTYYIQLPNMYYKLSSLQYDSARAASSYAIRSFYGDYLLNAGVDEQTVQIFWTDSQPVPYNIGLDLSAKADKWSDLLQIIEQISSKFNPDVFLGMREFWFMPIRRDLKLKLDNISIEYSDDLDEESRRELTATFSITIEAVLYHPITDGSIIDRIVTRVSPRLSSHVSAAESDTWVFDLSGNYTPTTAVDSAGYREGSLNYRWNFSDLIGADSGYRSSGYNLISDADSAITKAYWFSTLSGGDERQGGLK